MYFLGVNLVDNVTVVKADGEFVLGGGIRSSSDVSMIPTLPVMEKNLDRPAGIHVGQHQGHVREQGWWCC
jgi:hypothetical protein